MVKFIKVKCSTSILTKLLMVVVGDNKLHQKDRVIAIKEGIQTCFLTSYGLLLYMSMHIRDEK